MATHTGKEGIVKIGSVTIAELNSWSIDVTVEMPEDTEAADAWKTFKVDQKGWTGSIECHWDPDDATGQEALTAGAEVTLNFYGEGAASGALEYSGAAIISSVGIAHTKGGVTSRSFGVQGNGILNINTVP